MLCGIPLQENYTQDCETLLAKKNMLRWYWRLLKNFSLRRNTPKPVWVVCEILFVWQEIHGALLQRGAHELISLKCNWSFTVCLLIHMNTSLKGLGVSFWNTASYTWSCTFTVYLLDWYNRWCFSATQKQIKTKQRFEEGILGYLIYV